MAAAEPTQAAADAALAAALFALDPAGLGGVAVRSGAGAVRDRWMAGARAMLAPGVPVGRAPLGIADDRLLGGLDLSASLAAGRPVLDRGVLATSDGGIVIVPMAERLEEATSARLCAALDAGEVVIAREGLTATLPARVGLILLDEGADPEERPPSALLDRLAFRVDLSGESVRAPAPTLPAPVSVAEARERLGSVVVPDALLEALCAAAAAFGVDSLRAPLLAVRTARAHAALNGRPVALPADAAAAVRLVLAPRATSLPAMMEEDAVEQEEPPPPAQSDASAAAAEDDHPRPLDADAEMLVAATQAALPSGLLDRIVADNTRLQRTPRRSGAGEAAKSARRGRPLASRPGALRPGDRLDLPATLRAAAPWRRLRASGDGGPLIPVRPSDFRIRRFSQRRESTTIFVVDASGSAAFQRLAEAKGAVELLLGEAYVSRARVALVAFRETGAQVLLAPTRSLTRAKRSLADLPGGGGTPLAAGLEAAHALALAERAKDRTPRLVILTDGRANVALDGSGGRAAADRDALAAAARLAQARIGAAFLDTSPRPQPGGDRFARAMNAAYAPLPYADAHRVRAVVDALGA